MRKRNKKRDEFLLDHKDVPYITDQVKGSASPFLPDRSRAPLDTAAVKRFVSLTPADQVLVSRTVSRPAGAEHQFVAGYSRPVHDTIEA